MSAFDPKRTSAISIWHLSPKLDFDFAWLFPAKSHRNKTELNPSFSAGEFRVPPLGAMSAFGN
jgi:hypothetical protein